MLSPLPLSLSSRNLVNSFPENVVLEKKCCLGDGRGRSIYTDCIDVKYDDINL